jgi:hypothetical protein
MKVLFEARVMVAIVLAIVGTWTTANFERVEDLSAYRGGADCSQVGTGVSCNQAGTNCIKCDSNGTDLTCKAYENENDCVGCTSGQYRDCSGNTLVGTPIYQYEPGQPTKWIGCENFQQSGTCSRTYEDADQADCTPGKTC